jgi:dUTP pyrophosphatase
MKIKLIDFGLAPAKPVRAHYNDAGADVIASQGTLLLERTTEKIGLGFGVEIPDGYVGFIFPRSSLSSMGITCELPPIDSGYRGEIHAVLTNHTDQPFYVAPGFRIGQLVILPCVLADFEWQLGDERGTGAFGSTGE